MLAKTSNFFVSTHGPKGYINFFSSNFSKLDHEVWLSAFPDSTMDMIVKESINRNYDTQIIRNPLDNSILGVIIPKTNSGVINFPLYDTINPTILSIINDDYMNATRNCFDEAYKEFAQALAIHDDWESIYIKNTDFDKIDSLCQETIKTVINNKSLNREGKRSDRFFGATTIHGPVNYINDITDSISKRYFIKGRPGTGKSTFLRKIALNALSSGFDTEIYHCAFDSNSLDMIVIPQLDTCLFDSTSPHEYFPSRSGDEIIDIYACAVKQDTDEKYREELKTISESYSAKIAQGREKLVCAYEHYVELIKMYHNKILPHLLEIEEQHILRSIFPK